MSAVALRGQALVNERLKRHLAVNDDGTISRDLTEPPSFLFVFKKFRHAFKGSN